MSGRCQACGRNVEIYVEPEPRGIRQMHLYGAPTSYVCSPGCALCVSNARDLIERGWMLTPYLLRQEARA